MAGVVPSQEFNAQLVRTVRAELRRVTYEHPTPTNNQVPRQQSHLGFLTSAISASTDPRLDWESQPTGTVEVYRHDSDGELVATGDELTVYSRRSVAFVADTFVEIQYKWGKWQLVDANCEATAL